MNGLCQMTASWLIGGGGGGGKRAESLTRERIAVRHQGILRDLFTPQGTAKLVGGDDSNDGLILEEHLSPPAEFPDTQFLTHMIAVVKGRQCVRSAPLEKLTVEKRAACWFLGGGVFEHGSAVTDKVIRWGTVFSNASVLSIGIPMMERAMPEPFAQRPVELITVRAGERDSVPVIGI